MRTNWREYDFSEAHDNRWRNIYHIADVKWKMRRGQYLTLRYQPVRSLRISDGKKSVHASTDRLAINANLARKLAGLQYRNTIGMAHQRNQYAITPGSQLSNSSVQLMSLQNIIVGRHSIFSHTAYNHVNNPSAFIFFNTSFNSDWGITYSLGKRISASSSINYQSVQGWYRQAAVKQSFSGSLGKNINVYMYVDAGKNLKVFQPVPYNTIRAEWSIQYLFNQ